nr:cell division protein [Oedogonium sp. 260-2_chl]
MLYSYKIKLWNDHKKKIFFYSNNSINSNSRIEITKQEKRYKNFQKINFNQKHQFTIKKRFTFDWHIRPKQIQGGATLFSNNKKLLKLASFYSQLNSNEFSNKFTSLMIFHLKSPMQKLKIKKQNITTLELYSSDKSLDRLPFSSKIKRFSNFTDIELENNKNLFVNLQYKKNIWFSKIFIPFSNRTFWWILLPTQSILTHIRWNLFFKRITNLLEIIKISPFTRNHGTKWNSTVLFDFFPEFLIEKPIHWYWMLPFFGYIGLMKSNTTYINSYFFQNYSPTYTLQNKFDLNMYSTFSKNPIQKSISWEIFEFFDYKKFLFDSSFKYINNFFLNDNNFILQSKKNWLSRQKEHYICNYQDDLVEKYFKKNVNQLTKLFIIYWWKKNWQEITYLKSLLQYNCIENPMLLLPYLNEDKFLIKNISWNTNTKFYSFDSFLYSKFYWYWYNLDTKNINDFLNINYSKILLKNHSRIHRKDSVYKVLSKANLVLPLVSSLFYTTKFLSPVDINSELINSSSIRFSQPINVFPLKINYPWLSYNFQNIQIKQKRHIKINGNYNSITEIITNNFQNIQMNSQTNNHYQKNFIQRQKINLLFKHILLSNFINKQNWKRKVASSLILLFPLYFNNTLSQSSFLFCVSSKNGSKMLSNQRLKNDLELRKKEEIRRFSSVMLNYKTKKAVNQSQLLLKKKQNYVFQLTLYNSIGCEIFESDFNPFYKLSNIELKNIKFSEVKKCNLAYSSKINDDKESGTRKGIMKQNSKKNQSISSFHRASFLLDNLLSTFCFQLRMTCLRTSNFIYYYNKMLNKLDTKNIMLTHFSTLFTSIDEKMIKIHKHPIIMSGYNLPDLNLILKERNKKFRDFSNRITIKNQIDWDLALTPNSVSNKKNFYNLCNLNQLQINKSNYNYNKFLNLNFAGSSLSIIKKQKLRILKRKYKQIDLKSKKLERFFIYNLLKNYQHLLSKFIKLERNLKKIEYNKQFFNIKNHSKYKILRQIPLLDLQNLIIKRKKKKILINNKKDHNTLILLDYSNDMKKKFQDFIFSKYPLSIIKIKKDKFVNSFNNILTFRHVTNQSIFWNYITSNYSFRLLDTTQPFIFDKLYDCMKNTRINILNKHIQNRKKGYLFSNFLLQKYQRKNKNWPGGANPQGFFYKRINKLNFKSIQKKQFVEQIKEGNIEITKIFKIQSKQLKKISDVKPIGELLWEVRTKHKIPEVLLLQQTLFFQKKLVRKSTEENNSFNQSSSEKNSFSQKVQTFVRKMTQRRSYRKHVFFETLFDWTRDAIILRKMLRKINFKNDWQIFLKFILKANKTSLYSVHRRLPDYYSNWYKKNFYNDTKFVKKYLISHSLSIHLNKTYQKIFKIDNIRPFFYKLIQIETNKNKKLLLSKEILSLVLKDFYKNLLIDYTLVKDNNKEMREQLNLKNKKTSFYDKFKTTHFVSLSLGDIKSFSNFTNLLLFPESKLFYYYYLSLQNLFIQTQFPDFIKKKNNINKLFHSSSLIFQSSSSLYSLIPFIRKNEAINSFINPNTSKEYYYNNFYNGINYYNFINQQNLSKTSFPLYKKKKEWSAKDFIINKKSLNSTRLNDNLASPVAFSLNKNLLKNKESTTHKHKEPCKQRSNNHSKSVANSLFSSFLLNFSTILNFSHYRKISQWDNYNKFFELNNNYENPSNSSERQSFVKKQQEQRGELYFYSNELSIRFRLFFKKLYFTNIFWHSNDFLFNTTSTIFNQNELIKNVILNNWILKIKTIDSEQNYQKEFNLNFQKVLTTFSTWQYKFQIRRDVILQIFYLYLDHIGAFLNNVINKLIFENIVNQIENWIFFNQIQFVITKEPIKPLPFTSSLNLKNDLIIQPTWSFDLLNHIQTQYPHLYNKIQRNNPYKFKNIEFNGETSNLLIKTPELDSKKQIMFSPDFKTQFFVIDSFRKNTGRKAGFLKTHNIISNAYNNSINIPFFHQSIIQKLSSQTLIIQNSTLFCQKWIHNRQFLNLYKIKFLKKQKKLQQILNVFYEEKQNSITMFNKENNKIISLPSSYLNFKRNPLKSQAMGLKRGTGFLFNRSLNTTNFNSFSSLSKITRGCISLYVSQNLDSSLNNLIFLSQMLLLHVCLIFCLISVYQSSFHFCLKTSVSFFVILIYYFLNIRYRLKRLIKYIYQTIAQPFLTKIHEYIHSYDSIHHKFLLFFNHFSTIMFSNQFFIWGKLYKSFVPSFIHFLFKNPLNLVLERTIFFKSTKKLILSEKVKVNTPVFFHHVQYFFHDIKQNHLRNQKASTLKKSLIEETNFSKIGYQQIVNNRMSLLRNTNIIKKDYFDKYQKDEVPLGFIMSNPIQYINNVPTSFFWEKEYSNKNHLLKTWIKKEKLTKVKIKESSTFQLNLKLLKWNLGLILFIGESDIFAELEPYREMHWYFLKRLPIFLRSNTYSEDPINMYDYQADEKLRKFKEQFKKSTEIFQKRQNTIERKTQRNIKKEYAFEKSNVNDHKLIKNSEKLNFELMNKKYTNKKNNPETLILFIKSDKQFKNEFIIVTDGQYINKISNLLTNFSFFRKKVSRGQPFWKPLFSFLAHTLFISRLSKLNRRFKDSLLILNSSWITFGPLMAIICNFLWKNYILNFSNFLNNKNYLVNVFESSKKNKRLNNNLLLSISLLEDTNFKQNNRIINLNKFNFYEILEFQKQLNKKNNLQKISSYSSPFKVTILSYNGITNFEYKKFSQEIKQIWENINYQNYFFSQHSPPLFNRIFLWNFIKFEKKYERAIFKCISNKKNSINKVQRKVDFLIFPEITPVLLNTKMSDKSSQETRHIINKYKSIYINNQEQSAQNRYIHYNTYDPKVRLYRFYTNFSKNCNDIGILQDAKNVHPLFGSLLCEIYSGLFSIEANKRKRNIFEKQFSKTQYHFSPSLSTKNILLIGNTNSSNFVLLVQAFAAETGLKLFMEDAKRLRRLGRRGINKSTKRLEKLFEIAQSHSPSIIFLEDIDVIGSKRRVIRINEEEDDDDMAIRSFFSKLIYRKQHNSKSLSKSFVHQNLFINNQEVYRNMQKSIIPESPIPLNLIKYQLTRRKAFSNYFSNTSNSSYKTFITKFNILKKGSDGNFSNTISSSPTNAVIIWKLLKSKLVTPKKTIKEAPWKHIPVDSMRSIPLITYSIKVKVAKLTMLAIYTMNTQLRLVKDLIKLLEKIQYENYKGFIVFATTNKLASLDPSLRRPGRFDETVYLPSLTVNTSFQHVGRIHFINFLSIDSANFVNFVRTFNIINASNFIINCKINSVYSNVFLQDNSQKLFYHNRISLRDLIHSSAERVYNQNIFMQKQNHVFLNFVSYDILGNMGFQNPNFSVYSKPVSLLSLAYSKAGQLIINLFFQKQDNKKDFFKVNNSKKILNKLALNSENNELTLWPNSYVFSQFKKIHISSISQQKNIKNWLIYYFAGKIGEFCFFSFYKNSENNLQSYKKNPIESHKKMKFTYFFQKNSLGLRSLYGIQPNWKNTNSSVFFLIRTSCLYSKNHLISKLFDLDDIFKKRQRIFSDNLGPSLLYEYFNVNTEYFLKRNNISLEEQLQKQQIQKYILNLQKKPLRKFLLNSTAIHIPKNRSYFNKIPSQNFLLTQQTKNQQQDGKGNNRLALFRILFNELGSLDLIALRPTAMNYYYDKKIVSKHRFRKYTYKWWNWHFKKTIDSLEEFQYLAFFPYADKQYNPRRQRWMLTKGYSAYWLSQEKILYYQIYEQLIIECFQRSYLHLDKHREMLDYLVQLLLTKQLLTEIEWVLFFKRFL